MINFTELAFRDHLLRDTGLRIVDGADLDCQLLTILLLCVIKDLGIRIACCHRLLGIARESCCHDCSRNGSVQVVVYADLDFIDVISLQHLTEVLIQVLLIQSILLAPCHQSVLLDFGSRYDLQIVAESFQILDNGHMSVRDHTAADDTNSQFFHD